MAGSLSCLQVKKYPGVKYNYESANTKGLFVVGELMHSRDFGTAAGGFIHGFRHLTVALFQLLEMDHHGQKWPQAQKFAPKSADLRNESAPALDIITNSLVHRFGRAPGPYHMFQVLQDVVVFLKNGEAVLLHSVPRAAVVKVIDSGFGNNATRYLTVTWAYGERFSGRGTDVFFDSRLALNASEAHRSNFRHPVIETYLGDEESWSQCTRHHVLDDANLGWSDRRVHVGPLQRHLDLFFGMNTIEDCLDWMKQQPKFVQLGKAEKQDIQFNDLLFDSTDEERKIGEVVTKVWLS